MTCLTDPFSKQILNNFSDLQAFLSGKEEIDWISQSENRDNRTYVSKLYYNRWQIAWICVKAPFEWIFVLFCEAVAFLSEKLGSTRLNRVFTLLAKHHQADFSSFESQHTYGKQFLIPSRNFHHLWTCDYYNKDSLPVSSIEDAQVKELLFDTSLANEHSHSKLLKKPVEGLQIKNIVENLKKIHYIHFYIRNGLCRGDTSWWLYLFLSTQHLFKNPYHHIIAVSKMFEKGVSRQAALLQQLNLAESKVLKMSFNYSLNISQQQIEQNSEAAIESLKKLPAGPYGVGLHNHRIAYVKIDDQLGFVRDPNRGVIALEGPNQANELLNYIRPYNNHADASSVYFESTSLISSD